MTHECPDIELQLTGFAAGDLDGEEAAAVAGHLAVCCDCRRELERELALRRTLAGLPVETVELDEPTAAAPATGTTILRRLPTIRQAWLPLAGGLAAAALAVSLLVPGGPDTGGPLPPAPGTVYTSADVAAARRDVRTSLVMAAEILEKSERLAVADVFGRRLPRAVEGSLSSAADKTEGGQG